MLLRPSNIVRYILVLMIFMSISACGGGGDSGAAPSTFRAGVLQVTSADGQQTIGGTHQYIVSLSGNPSLPSPLQVNITSMNPEIASIELNNCPTSPVTTFSGHATYRCDFYIKDNAVGTTSISVAANGFTSVTESVTIGQEWGTFSSTIGTDTLSFGGEGRVYTYGSEFVLVSQGYGWQQVGGGKVNANGFDVFYGLVSDDTHVCVAFENQDIHTLRVQCSTNGGAWQSLPLLQPGFDFASMSLARGNVYILGSGSPIIYEVEMCPVNNCTNWQQKGESFDPHDSTRTYMFESTPYVAERTGQLYYQTESGNWQIYGDFSSFGSGFFMTASNFGVTLLPVDNNPPPYQQDVYYNASNNIGGVFSLIGGTIPINSIPELGGRIGKQPLTSTDNSIFVAPGDGNVYASLNTLNVWALWLQVGTNNPPLTSIYLHDNKLYSVDTSNKKTQIYIYPLDYK